MNGTVLYPGDFAHGRVELSSDATTAPLTLRLELPEGVELLRGSSQIDGAVASARRDGDHWLLDVGTIDGTAGVTFAVRATDGIGVNGIDDVHARAYDVLRRAAEGFERRNADLEAPQRLCVCVSLDRATVRADRRRSRDVNVVSYAHGT